MFQYSRVIEGQTYGQSGQTDRNAAAIVGYVGLPSFAYGEAR